MKAAASVSRDRLLIPAEGGFTLIEVLISITLLALMMLALYRSAALIMARNVENSMQDTCIKVANEKIEELRNTPFSSLSSGTDNVTRRVRNFYRTFVREVFLNKRSDTLYTATVTVKWRLHPGDEYHTCSLTTAIADYGD